MTAATLESRIDALYSSALSGFVEARTALARTLTGADAQRVRKLPKPTVVPWAVNQVYWRARPVWNALIKSGERLHDAQVAALEGRAADLRAATEAHRRAIAEAVKKAEHIASEEGVRPATDALARTLEALSLKHGVEAPGRLTTALEPAGFEALAGVTIAAQPPEKREPEPSKAEAAPPIDKKAEAARKKHETEVKKAEAALERARRRMAEAEAALKQTRDRG
jgi:hypothetical protein